MKKKYTMTLDEEKVQILKEYLHRGGMSFSGYMNQQVNEFVAVVGYMNLPDDVSKIPLGQFVDTFNRMLKGLKKD
jgi:hypothetical protein